MNAPARIMLRLAAVLFGLALAAAVAAGVVALNFLRDLPSVETLADIQFRVPLRIYTADGDLVAEYGDERRIPVDMEQVPPRLVDAILAAEDDAFFRHHGVDPAGIVRAALANLRSGETEQGASTITMQVARNYFLSPEKTYTRKIREVLLALRIEQALSKEQILELYLNKIFLGHRAYGVAAAARVYYGKGLDELTLPEMAVIAGLPRAPSRDNPLTSPENARKRRNYVLHRLHSLGKIDDAQYQAALEAPLTAQRQTTAIELDAPYVAEMARTAVVDRFGEEAYAAGYRVFTTVRSREQRAAQAALRSGLKAYDRRHGYRGPLAHHDADADTTPGTLDQWLKEVPSSEEMRPAVVLEVRERSATVYTRGRELRELSWEGLKWARPQRGRGVGPEPGKASDVVAVGDVVYVEPLRTAESGEPAWRLSQLPEVAGALVSVEAGSGAVIALSGGFDYYLSKFNRVTQARRQPGSNIKPFIYSAALEHGFTPASLVSAAPVVVEGLDTVWRPENYSGRFFGPTRLRTALSKSLNLVSVRLMRAIGTGEMLDYLSRFGFDREQLPEGLSLALGSASLTPLEVVRGFTVFANGGYLVEPYWIERVEDIDGRVVYQANPTVVCPTCPEEAADPSGGADSADGILARRAPRVLRPANVFLMTSMMRDVIRSGTGRRAMELGRNDLAGKTGTSNDFRDAWFSGFNGDIASTVWVGFDEPRTLGRGEAGSRAALPIWMDYMRVALEGRPETPLRPPDSIVTAYVDSETGNASSSSSPDAFREYFVAGTEPRPGLAGAASAGTDGQGGSVGITEGLF